GRVRSPESLRPDQHSPTASRPPGVAETDSGGDDERHGWWQTQVALPEKSAMRRLLLGALVVASWLGLPPSLAPAQKSRAMGLDCRAAAANTSENRQRADQWVDQKLKAFLPAPEQALRMISLLEQAEQVKLALFGIMSTCEKYLAGNEAKDVADRALDGFESTVADF